MDITPPTGYAFMEIPLALRSAFPPFHLSTHDLQRDPTTMRSLLLVLTALPLMPFALTINHANSEAGNSPHNNGTTSNKYRLQHKYQGNTFFKYMEARLPFLPLY